MIPATLLRRVLYTAEIQRHLSLQWREYGRGPFNRPSSLASTLAHNVTKQGTRNANVRSIAIIEDIVLMARILGMKVHGQSHASVISNVNNRKTAWGHIFYHYQVTLIYSSRSEPYADSDPGLERNCPQKAFQHNRANKHPR